MRLLIWSALCVIALGTITPTLLAITTIRNLLDYIGDKLANILMCIDDNLEHELDRQRLTDLGKRYMKGKKQ